jgi:hypothetical protein
VFIGTATAQAAQRRGGFALLAGVRRFPEKTIQKEIGMSASVVSAERKLVCVAVAFGSAIGAASVSADDFGPWRKNIEVVPAPISTTGNEGCQFVTPDDLTMYFAAAGRSGSSGGNDLYVATRKTKNHSFDDPVPLAQLNTTSNDICPAVSPDGITFYFVSDRTGANPDLCQGGSDIFLATKTGTGPADWGNPQRLGCNVNSTAAEEGPQFFVNPNDGTTTLYFSSNATGTEFSQYNIYQVGGFNTTTGESESGRQLMPGVNTNANDRRGTIRQDGLEIILETDRAGSTKGGYNLWSLTRASVASDFDPNTATAVDALNSDGNEARPTLVGDGSTLFFMSNRGVAEGGVGGSDIWTAQRSNANSQGGNQQ